MRVADADAITQRPRGHAHCVNVPRVYLLDPITAEGHETPLMKNANRLDAINH